MKHSIAPLLMLAALSGCDLPDRRGSTYDYSGTFTRAESRNDGPEPEPTPAVPDIDRLSAAPGPDAADPQGTAAPHVPPPGAPGEGIVPAVSDPPQDLGPAPQPVDEFGQSPYLNLRPDIDRIDDLSQPEIDDVVQEHPRKKQLYIITECGWDERDRSGAYRSPCINCNLLAAAGRTLEEKAKGSVRVGDSLDDDVVYVDIKEEWGQRVDKEMGDGRHTLSELVGEQHGHGYESLVPFIVVLDPVEDPYIVVGWQGPKDPTGSDAAWYLSGLLGHRRDTPETWESSAQYGTFGSALAAWVKDDGRVRRDQSWGLSLTGDELLNLLKLQRHTQIAPLTTLVLPEGMQPRWDDSRVGRLTFHPAPYVEWKVGFLKHQKQLSYIDFSRDNSLIKIHAEGFRAHLPIKIDWTK